MSFVDRVHEGGSKKPRLEHPWIAGLEDLGKDTTSGEEYERMDTMSTKSRPLDHYYEEYGSWPERFFAPYDFWETRMKFLQARPTIVLPIVPMFSFMSRPVPHAAKHIQKMIDFVTRAPAETKIVGLFEREDTVAEGHLLCVVWHVARKEIVFHDSDDILMPVIRAFQKWFPSYGVRLGQGHRYEFVPDSRDSCVFKAHMSAEIELRNIDITSSISADAQKGYAVLINPHSTRLDPLVAAAIRKIDENETMDTRNRFYFSVHGSHARFEAIKEKWGSKQFRLTDPPKDLEQCIRLGIRNAKTIITTEDEAKTILYDFRRGVPVKPKIGYL
jgi:hypothetical protein